MMKLIMARRDGSEVLKRWSGGGGGTSGVTSTTLEPGQTWAIRAWVVPDTTAAWQPLNCSP